MYNGYNMDTMAPRPNQTVATLKTMGSNISRTSLTPNVSNLERRGRGNLSTNYSTFFLSIRNRVNNLNDYFY